MSLSDESSGSVGNPESSQVQKKKSQNYKPKYGYTFIFKGKSSSFVMEEIAKLENYTRHWIAELQQGTFEMVQSNQVSKSWPV